MRGSGQIERSIGVAIVAWLATFIASWVVISGVTGASGLGLVWGVFIALAAFEMARKSPRHGVVLVFLSLFLILLQGIYQMFA
jgi:hypothetical protein